MKTGISGGYRSSFTHVLCWAILVGFLTGCADEKPVGPKKSILFIGNSYTYVNNLPEVFKQLALSGGHPVFTGMVAPGGWKLIQHSVAKETLGKIAEQI